VWLDCRPIFPPYTCIKLLTVSYVYFYLENNSRANELFVVSWLNYLQTYPA
jgi:hypothetical protein